MALSETTLQVCETTKVQSMQVCETIKWLTQTTLQGASPPDPDLPEVVGYPEAGGANCHRRVAVGHWQCVEGLPNTYVKLNVLIYSSPSYIFATDI